MGGGGGGVGGGGNNGTFSFAEFQAGGGRREHCVFIRSQEKV